VLIITEESLERSKALRFCRNDSTDDAKTKLSASALRILLGKSTQWSFR